MSGGSYDYAYTHVESMAARLGQKTETPLRRAFAQHLKWVADAMHAIEWVDSCDWSRGDEVEAVQKVLGTEASTLELRVLVDDARAARDALVQALERVAAE
jgi:hypothetical protein